MANFENFQLESYTFEYFFNCLQRYDISIDQVSAFVSDGASNLIKVGKILHEKNQNGL